MTLPLAASIHSARVSGRALADHTTSFIFNEWYVAALADEIGRSLLPRTLLGRAVVMFRTLAGVPVALDDRCAHRSFPLSASKLDGDTIVCGYHGLRYDSQGDCREIPSQTACPKGIGVHSYPLMERGPLVWIWMGDPALAQTTAPPDQPWLESADWVRSHGYLPLRASYVSLHENLMDLTHLSFLHAGTFGTPDYAAAPYDTDIEEGHFTITRRVMSTRLPPVWAEPTGITGDRAARITASEFISPALHVVSGTFYDTASASEPPQQFRIKTAHIPTPESAGSTHYFIVHGRDFALARPDVTSFMHDQLFLAFQEDVRGLELVAVTQAAAGEDLFEISIASDRAGVAMRKYLKQRAERDNARQPLRSSWRVPATDHGNTTRSPEPPRN